MALRDYLQLIRFKYHLSFATVILGVLFSNAPFMIVWKPLLLLYFAFNVLLYGGLYTINDIADAKSDAKHPLKRKRPLPSRRISARAAMIFALILIFSGLLIGYLFFDRLIFIMLLIFVALNMLYTFAAKKLAYIELVANSLTHPLRAALGIVVGGAALPPKILLAAFFLAIGIATVRRMIEKSSEGWHARKALKQYTYARLLLIQLVSFCALLLLFWYDYPNHAPWYFLLVLLYLALVFGIYFSRKLRRINRKRWLH